MELNYENMHKLFNAKNVFEDVLIKMFGSNIKGHFNYIHKNDHEIIVNILNALLVRFKIDNDFMAITEVFYDEDDLTLEDLLTIFEVDEVNTFKWLQDHSLAVSTFDSIHYNVYGKHIEMDLSKLDEDI